MPSAPSGATACSSSAYSPYLTAGEYSVDVLLRKYANLELTQYHWYSSYRYS